MPGTSQRENFQKENKNISWLPWCHVLCAPVLVSPDQFPVLHLCLSSSCTYTPRSPHPPSVRECGHAGSVTHQQTLMLFRSCIIRLPSLCFFFFKNISVLQETLVLWRDMNCYLCRIVSDVSDDCGFIKVWCDRQGDRYCEMHPLEKQYATLLSNKRKKKNSIISVPRH